MLATISTINFTYTKELRKEFFLFLTNVFPLTGSLELEHTIHTFKDSYKILSRKSTTERQRNPVFLMQHRRKAENLRKRKRKRRGKRKRRPSDVNGLSSFDEHCATFRESNAIFANLTGIELTLQWNAPRREIENCENNLFKIYWLASTFQRTFLACQYVDQEKLFQPSYFEYEIIVIRCNIYIAF